ncbi:hypothetical protein B4U80_03787 [Leptotrombidium deliense]|uniref:Ankyrin repeat domain-containing protein 12 n=1 Tax=Leptotrombidium deliense TaxID=299467 RepID=A0A443SCG1_9ACAR|nr:hypothetical protein B4U80_03787 [Leptotrombidium deliense]
MNAEQSSERNEATAAGNGMTSPKSSSSSNAPSSSNAVSSKPTSPASNQSEPKVPSLRIVISSSGSTSGSTSATSSVSQSTSDINKVSSSNTLSGQSSTSSKNLPYVVSSSTTAADPNEEVGTSEYEMSALSGVSTSANVSTSGRVTRSSQRAAQQQQQKGDGDSERHSTSPTSTSSSLGKRDSSVKETVEPNQASAAGGSGSVKDEKSELKDQMPRKRKLRNKQPNQNQQGNKQASEQDEDNESTSSSTSSGVGGANCGSTSAVSTEKELKNAKEFQMPSYNCYHMYLNIRKQVDKRRRQMFPVQPKAPQGFKDYLLNKGSYLLEGKLCLPDSAGNGKNVPVMAPPPAILKPGTGLYNLHIDQERTRHKLRLRHLIEREKLQLSTEQEVLRVHGRAALAMANQSVPFSVCTILKDEEIYNTIESESDSTSTESVQNSSASNVSRNEYQRTTYTTSANNTNSATDLVTLTGNPGGPGARSRYNGRLFISWLQDVDDKWEKIKADTISRQKRESESLHAIQKLEWEWKMKEVGACDVKTSPLIDDTLVPAVQVSEDFDLLPV